MGKKKNEITNHSSATEYLTIVVSTINHAGSYDHLQPGNRSVEDGKNILLSKSPLARPYQETGSV